MTEYGLFDPDGQCVERGYFSLDAARSACYASEPDDDLSVHPMCPDHWGQPADACNEHHA